MFNSSNPSDIITFLQRVDPTVAAGKTPIEAWRAYLAKTTGQNGTLADLETAWLIKQGASGKGRGDLVHSYLNSKGYGSGTTQDKLKNYFRGVASP